MSQKVKGAVMCNMCDTVFYMKMNVLQNFHICISVPLKARKRSCHEPHFIMSVEKYVWRIQKS